MLQWIGSVLVQIMVCSLYGAKPSSKPFYCKCSEYKEIHLHFLFFLNTEMAQVIEILLCEGQEAVNLISQYHGCWWPGNVRTSAIIVLSQFAWYIPIWVPGSFTFPLKSYNEVIILFPNLINSVHLMSKFTRLHLSDFLKQSTHIMILISCKFIIDRIVSHSWPISRLCQIAN